MLLVQTSCLSCIRDMSIHPFLEMSFHVYYSFLISFQYSFSLSLILDKMLQEKMNNWFFIAWFYQDQHDWIPREQLRWTDRPSGRDVDIGVSSETTRRWSRSMFSHFIKLIIKLSSFISINLNYDFFIIIFQQSISVIYWIWGLLQFP